MVQQQLFKRHRTRLSTIPAHESARKRLADGFRPPSLSRPLLSLCDCFVDARDAGLYQNRSFSWFLSSNKMSVFATPSILVFGLMTYIQPPINLPCHYHCPEREDGEYHVGYQ